MLKRKFTIAEVAAACISAFARLKVDLPGEIADRLKTARVAYRHGTDVMIFQYNAWDVGERGDVRGFHDGGSGARRGKRVARQGACVLIPDNHRDAEPCVAASIGASSNIG